MSDYITLTTTNVLQGPDGAGSSGTLWAEMTGPVVLAGGDVVPPFRQSYTVTTGAAAGLTLPITEDANPAGRAILLYLVDAQGRKTWESAIVTPRSDGPIGLELLLPVGGFEP